MQTMEAITRLRFYPGVDAATGVGNLLAYKTLVQAPILAFCG